MNARQIAIAPARQDVYSLVQREVEAGASALRRGDSDIAIISFQSALQKLSIIDPFHDHLVHNLLLSFKLRIRQKLSLGDASAARKDIERALQLEILGDMAADENFHRSFSEAFQQLGVLLLSYKLSEESVACCRKSISIASGPGSQINLTNALIASGGPAELSDFTSAITREQLGRHIFIACAPKSGSTFLKNVLLALSGYRDAFMVNSGSQFEQELYLPTLCHTAPFDTVTQQHCRASDINVHLLQAFEIRPVVLVRNILDSVMSLFDFYSGGAFANSYFREDFQSLDRETKLDLIIDNLVPWYFQFVASWSLAERNKRVELMWLSYEEMIKDKAGSIRKVLGFYGLGAPAKGVEYTIKQIESQKERTRFNKGVAGRGEIGLNHAQKDRILRLARYYPSTDLSRLGVQ
jgi:hypothetical protein